MDTNHSFRNYKDDVLIPASPEELFAYVDDHALFSSHMNKPSWFMGGGKMDISVDAGQGRRIGSHIRMSGKALGITVYLDEVVLRHDPPYVKSWETVGTPKLLVVGQYRMGIEIRPESDGSRLRVTIDYALPTTHVWLGRMFGRMYAKWCVRQMINGARDAFKTRTRS